MMEKEIIKMDAPTWSLGKLRGGPSLPGCAVHVY